MCQGKRNDILEEIARLNGMDTPETCGHDVHKSKSRDSIGEEYGLSGRSVARLLRINELVPELKEQLDNGELNLLVAVALLLTCGDGEERAEVYGCAADRQQASIVFEVAADMVRMCPALNKRVKILASQKRIVYQPTNSFYQVLSAEAYSKHGFNIHGVVFDELHTQPNRKLFDVMTKGSGDARMQPL